MNVFSLDPDPRVAAIEHVDSHVTKGILELGQMLAMPQPDKILFHRLCPEFPSGHFHHPVARWVRASSGNYDWTAALMVALCLEFRVRYGHAHAWAESAAFLWHHQPSLPTGPWRPRAFVPAECKTRDVHESYREYYRLHKTHLHRWTNREKPSWL